MKWMSVLFYSRVINVVTVVQTLHWNLGKEFTETGFRYLSSEPSDAM